MPNEYQGVNTTENTTDHTKWNGVAMSWQLAKRHPILQQVQHNTTLKFSDALRMKVSNLSIAIVGLALCAAGNQLLLPWADAQQDQNYITAPLADEQEPSIVAVYPPPGPVTNLTAISVIFSKPVTGVDAGDLRINDIPAIGLLGSGTTYTFTFPPPPLGIVQISWDMNCGIVDLASPPNRFNPTGVTARWTYELYDAGPLLVSAIHPPENRKLRQLSQIEITFNKSVSGVEATDLLVNGQLAKTVHGAAAGPYVFEFVPITRGPVNVTWSTTHGITDTTPARRTLETSSWSYFIDPDTPIPKLMITEVMAENATGLKDEDGDAEDWIELCNAWTNTVDLTGWSLSDDPKDPGKWVFPAVAIGPGKYLVVFASGKDRKPTAAGTRLHTNFKLAINGEYLGLFMPESPRLAVSELEFPEQRIDFSYGRDREGTWRYYAGGSPGAPN
ncbi:MAG: lamin tail domain-containing protein, partial [Verrucomicrobiae bacterium]|nr:lamin tail domain-containing protein [Verrucomicrobiae bacterium]